MAEIACVGILVEDTFCGPMKELPHEGRLLAVDAMPIKVGGCAANVALDLVKQGLSVDIIGCLGRDSAAKSLISSLEKQQISCGHMVYSDQYPTSKTVVLLVEGQDRRFIHMFGANQALSARDVQHAWLEGVKIFYLGGLFAMPGIQTAELLELLKYCRSKGIVTVVDVVISQGWESSDELTVLLPEIDYFLPNDDEAHQITGLTDPAEQLRFFQKCGAHTVIITQGKAGAIASRDGHVWHSEIFPAKVLDPSGSGDAFSSGIITAIRRGWDMPKMLRYASALGSSATRAVGTTDGVFTATEAEAFLAANTLKVTSGSL
ncbi:MAG: carbohydrate kinase family protein [Opitutaceae bacterium]